ncbi:MAG: tetratricopeptide repeat protein, partial [Chloroflexota bacterium]
ILNRLVRAYFLKYNPDDRTIAMHPIDRDYCYNRIDDNERQSLHAQIADLYAEHYNPDADGLRSIADLAAPLSSVFHRIRAEQYDRAAEHIIDLDRRYMNIWGNDTELAALYAQVIRFINSDDLLRTVTLRYGEALRRVGHLPEAIAHFERARELASEHEDGHDMANALNSMGWAHYDTGQFTEAIAYWENALSIYRETGNRSGEGDTLSGMGWVSYLMGSYEQALNYVQDALRIFGEIGGHMHRVGMNIGDSGVIRAAQGHYDTALQNLRESLSIAAMNNSLNERSYKGGYLAMVLLLAEPASS